MIYTRVVRQAKRMHYCDLMNTSVNKNKTAWRIIGQDKKSKSRTNTNLKVNNQDVSDNFECASIFNSHFQSVHRKFILNLDKSRNVNGINSNLRSFFFTPVTSQDIFTEVFRLKSSNSCGYDNINSILLKYCADAISEPLSIIINNSLANGHFPSLLKIIKGIPLFKSGDTSCVDNYRLLSISSSFSKIFERVVAGQLLDFFNKNELLNDNQHGFRKNRSTSTAILQFLNNLYSALDKGKTSMGFFLDLSKAFDLVNHDILLEKLQSYGIRGVTLNWIKSFLYDRMQYVELSGVQSEQLPINRGVAQGSVLGPLLYIIYTNDIPGNNLVMYADDTSVLVQTDDYRSMSLSASNQLEDLNSYLSSNELFLNYTKTVFMQFSLSKKNLDFSYWIRVNNHCIKRSSEVKFLGITLDGELKWIHHIDGICKKLGPMCYALGRLRHLVDVATLKLYYFGYVHAIISYGILAWGSSSGILRVLIMQKRAIRSMVGVGPMVSCRPYFRELNIMTVVGVYIYKTLLQVRENIDSYKKLNSSHTYSTRCENTIEYPLHKTSSYEASPHYMAIRLYNSLPDPLKCLQVRAFKLKIKSIIIERVFYSIDEFFIGVDSW